MASFFGGSESDEKQNKSCEKKKRVGSFCTALSTAGRTHQPTTMAGVVSTSAADGEEPPASPRLPMQRSEWATSALGGNFRSPAVEAAFWEYMMPM